VILPTTGGLGDTLMLTTVAREVRKRNPGTLIHVITKVPAVFDRNPDVDFVSRKNAGTFAWQRPLRVSYNLGFPWQKHFIYSLCADVNLTSQVGLRTYIFPAEADWAFADKITEELQEAPIIIARTGGVTNYDKKVWPLNHWSELVNRLISSGPVVDVGVAGKPLEIASPRYLSLLGQTTLHQLAALIARAKALVTVDSGPNHIAAAFDTPTVCILGGVFPPEAIRYPHTKVLINRPDCCDCWPIRGCPRNLECLTNIKVESVLNELNESMRIRPGKGSNGRPDIGRRVPVLAGH